MHPHKHPKLIVLTGPSGSGKTTLRTRLLAENIYGLKNLITCTSRPKRANETNGVHYHFFDEPTLSRMIRNGEMLEHANVYGNLYGSRILDVDEALREGHSPFFTVDVQGAITMQEKYDPAVVIFVKTPVIADLGTLLIGRKTDSPDVIQTRLQTAQTELALESRFQYVVTNEIGKFEDTYNRVRDIISHEVHNNKVRSKRLLLELK